MDIPEKYKRYLVGKFEQGDEIQKRADYYLSLLTNAKAVLEQNPQAMNATAGKLYSGNVENLKQALNNRAGACQCLAIKWLKLKMKEQSSGKTGKHKISSDTRLDKLRDPDRLDKVLRKMSEASSKQTFIYAFEEAMNQFHVTPKPHWNGTVPLAKLCKDVMSQPHSYFVVGINCPKLDGNHAVAVYTSDGGVFGSGKHAYVFDPNIGEIKFPLSDFGTLFPGLIAESYGSTEDSVLVFAQLVG